jgi:hypothetical protein
MTMYERKMMNFFHSLNFEQNSAVVYTILNFAW